MKQRLWCSFLAVIAWSALLPSCKAKFRSKVQKQGAENGGSDAVGESPNPTSDNAQPTASPAMERSISFTANNVGIKLSIKSGDAVTLRWDSKGYDSCSISPGDIEGLSGEKNLGALSAAQTYTMTCKVGLETASKNVEIVLEPETQGPVADLKAKIVGSSLAPSDGPLSVARGGGVILSWNVPAAIDCTLNPGGYQGMSGNVTVSSIEQATTFILSCSNASGNSQDAVVINVLAPPPTATFTVNDSSVGITTDKPIAVKLKWSAKNADECVLEPFPQIQGTSGEAVTSTPISVTTSFNLTCRGPGGSISINLPVLVRSILAGTADLKVNGKDGPVTVDYGSDIDVSWTSTNATDCVVRTHNNQEFTGLNGAQKLAKLEETALISLSCTYESATSAFDFVTVVVKKAPAPTMSFLANGNPGSVQINYNDNVALQWTSEHADECSIMPLNFTGTSGAQIITNVKNSQAYILTCRGPGGTAAAAVVVNVNPDPNGPCDFYCQLAEVERQCDQKTHEIKAFTAKLASPPACRWGQNDNLSQLIAANAYEFLRAREETSVDLTDVPAGAILCGIEELKSPGKIRHDDQMLLALNDLLLASSEKGFTEFLDDVYGLERYNWLKIRGDSGYRIFSANPPRYCVGLVTLPGACLIPERGVLGNFSVTVNNAVTRRISALARSEGVSKYTLKAAAFGDQDSDDCEFIDEPIGAPTNKDVELQMRVRYVLP